MQKFNTISQKGFTLIEVIVAVVIIAIVGTFSLNSLNYEDVKEKVDIEGAKLQSFFEEMQFNAILGRGFKDHTTGDWDLPDTRKIEVLLEDSAGLGNNAPPLANIKGFHTEDGVEKDYKTAITKDNYGKNPVVLQVKCTDLDGTETMLEMGRKLTIHFKGVNITDIKTDSDGACLNSPRTAEFIVGRARSKFKYSFVTDRIAGTITSKRGR